MTFVARSRVIVVATSIMVILYILAIGHIAFRHVKQVEDTIQLQEQVDSMQLRRDRNLIQSAEVVDSLARQQSISDSAALILNQHINSLK